GTSQHPRYHRHAEIDEQVRELKQEPLSYIEERAQVRYGHSEYVYSETLVELFFHWRDQGDRRAANRILKIILDRIKNRASAWCATARISDCEEFVGNVISNVGHQLANGNLDSHYFWCCNFIGALKRIFSKYYHEEKRRQQRIPQSLDASYGYSDDGAHHGVVLGDRIAVAEIDSIKQALSRMYVDHFFQLLKPAEVRVAKLLMDGYNQQEIAEQLGCTDRTVRNIIQRIKDVMISKGMISA
ncbi:MAG TPA: helix-turn-helix domain-containing protein, partial [Chthonomonas sp.]|uniref:helix-turn-helix domain-containing protein n=1 Tax=Chthonomonas sp. TaxID=2282153 RepID=UPI002B4AC811